MIIEMTLTIILKKIVTGTKINVIIEKNLYKINQVRL